VSVEDIYDRFGEPGAKLGKIANRLLKILGDKGFLATDSSGKKALLAKTKAVIESQREIFRALPVGGVKLVRKFTCLA
jgi:hypothetical protein